MRGNINGMRRPRLGHRHGVDGAVRGDRAIEKNVETTLGVAEWSRNSNNVADGSARTRDGLDPIEFAKRCDGEHDDRGIRQVTSDHSAAGGESGCRVVETTSDVLDESDGGFGRCGEADDESCRGRAHRSDVRKIGCTRLPPDVVSRRQADAKIRTLNHEIRRDRDSPVGHRHNCAIVTGAENGSA